MNKQQQNHKASSVASNDLLCRCHKRTPKMEQIDYPEFSGSSDDLLYARLEE